MVEEAVAVGVSQEAPGEQAEAGCHMEENPGGAMELEAEERPLFLTIPLVLEEAVAVEGVVRPPTAATMVRRMVQAQGMQVVSKSDWW